MDETDVEYWDLYTLNGEYAKTIRRGTVFSPKQYYHNVVEIIPVDGKGHLLITRRSLIKPKEPGLYEFPAGSVWAGETPNVAAIRELSEETGLQAENLTPIAITTAEGIHRHFFIAKIPNLLHAEISLQKKETMAYKICTIKEWYQLLAQGLFVKKRFMMYSPEVFENIENLIGTPRGRPKKNTPLKQSHRLMTADPLKGTRNGTSGHKSNLEYIEKNPQFILQDTEEYNYE